MKKLALERAFEQLGEIHELLLQVGQEAAEIDDLLFELRLKSLKRTLVAAGHRLRQMRVNAHLQGTWLDSHAEFERQEPGDEQA